MRLRLDEAGDAPPTGGKRLLVSDEGAWREPFSLLGSDSLPPIYPSSFLHIQLVSVVAQKMRHFFLF